MMKTPLPKNTINYYTYLASTFILCVALIFLSGCKSKITTEIILEKPNVEQQKGLENYLDLITKRAKKSGISIKVNSIDQTDGRIHMVFHGGDPELINELLFKQSLHFKLMQVVDENELWAFLNELDLSNVFYDSVVQLQNRIDSISKFLKVDLNFNSWAGIFGFSRIADNNYAGNLMDSLLINYFGKGYCEIAWGVPFIDDSLRVPLYLLKLNPYNPFENNDKFILNSSVSKNSMTGKPEINLKFKNNYTDAWSKMTAASIGQFIAISLNEKVIVAPKVNEQIDNGACTISTGMSDEEAIMISGMLTCDDLPFELKIISVNSE